MLGDDIRLGQIRKRSFHQLIVRAFAGDIPIRDDLIEDGLQFICNLRRAVENRPYDTFFSVVVSTVWEMSIVSGQLTIVEQGDLRGMFYRRALFIVTVPLVEHRKNKMHIHQTEFFFVLVDECYDTVPPRTFGSCEKLGERLALSAKRPE